MKIFISIIVLLLGIFICIIAVAHEPPKKHKIIFKNYSNIPISYFLYHINHQITSHKEPIAFVVGTLEPGKTWQVKREKGLYHIEWKNGDKILLKIEPFNFDKDMTFVYGKQ